MKLRTRIRTAWRALRGRDYEAEAMLAGLTHTHAMTKLRELEHLFSGPTVELREWSVTDYGVQVDMGREAARYCVKANCVQMPKRLVEHQRRLHSSVLCDLHASLEIDRFLIEQSRAEAAVIIRSRLEQVGMSLGSELTKQCLAGSGIGGPMP